MQCPLANRQPAAAHAHCREQARGRHLALHQALNYMCPAHANAAAMPCHATPWPCPGQPVSGHCCCLTASPPDLTQDAPPLAAVLANDHRCGVCCGAVDAAYRGAALHRLEHVDCGWVGECRGSRFGWHSIKREAASGAALRARNRHALPASRIRACSVQQLPAWTATALTGIGIFEEDDEGVSGANGQSVLLGQLDQAFIVAIKPAGTFEHGRVVGGACWLAGR